MNTLEIVSFVLILVAAVLGGFYPLTRREEARSDEGFPYGEAFTAGVFLALALVIMLPAGLHLFEKAFPGAILPWAGIIAIASFLILLAIEHAAFKAKLKAGEGALSPGSIPVIMTVMIALPSFLLGTALGLSETETALFILVAVLAHKSSAGFGLALTMVRSRLTQVETYILYTVFSLSTPLGIVAGADARHILSGQTLVIVKAITLSIAAGVFLYMSTMHEFSNAPFIRHCSRPKCFLFMLVGLLLTIGVKLILELGHAG
jgi:zinc transporter ZupT